MEQFRRVLLPVLILLLGLGVYLAIHLSSANNQKYTVLSNSQTIIKQIRSLNRLETAQYTIEKVIDAGTNEGRFQQLLFGDRILLIAHGTVIAGFDLSQLSENNITVDGDTLHITLPAPKILVTTLDPDQTRVYDRQTGLLTKGDKDLESTARGEAEKIITNAACQGGILTEATKNAKNELTALFTSLDFSSIVITVPKGSC